MPGTAAQLEGLVPFLIPENLGTEEYQRVYKNAIRYASRLPSVTQRMHGGDDEDADVSPSAAEAQLKDFVLERGSNVAGFLAALSQLASRLEAGERVHLLNDLLFISNFISHHLAQSGPKMRRSPSQSSMGASLSLQQHNSPGTTDRSGGASSPDLPPGERAHTVVEHTAGEGSPLLQIPSRIESHVAAAAGGLQSVELTAPATMHTNGQTPLLTFEPLPARLNRQAVYRQMVQDILHSAQGLDGTYVVLGVPNTFKSKVTQTGDRLLLKSEQALLLEMATLGWMYRRLNQLVAARVHAPSVLQRGLMHQAFAAAITQNEFKEFYRLIAMLQALAQRPVTPEDNGYLTPRRLRVWLKDPLRRMRILVDIAEACHEKKGGQLASVVHENTKSGNPYHAQYAMRLLRAVCGPLYTMIHYWIYQGELNDPLGDFFIAATGRQESEGRSFNAWRDRYMLRAELVPGFISQELARKILRAGKSINFLREKCGDVEWVQENANTARLDMPEFDQHQEPVQQLQKLVDRAAATVDERLKRIALEQLGLVDHCRAIKQLLLFGQGDFASSLLLHTADVLNKRSSEVMLLELADKLKKAMDASNVKYLDDDVQERLHIHKATNAGLEATVGDTMGLKYLMKDPLAALLTPAIMQRYEQISAFLWKVKVMEFVLQRVWLAIRQTSTTLDRKLRSRLDGSHAVHVLLRYAPRVHRGMNTLCQNLQAYLTYEVIEGAWEDFMHNVDKARDIDEIMDMHETYQKRILMHGLLDEASQDLRECLERMFACSKLIQAPLADMDAHVLTKAALWNQIEDNVKSGGWGEASNPDRRFVNELEMAAQDAMQKVYEVERTFTKHFEKFVKKQAGAINLDLRGLLMNMSTAFQKSAKEGGSGGGGH